MSKMFRTKAVSMYGARTILSGTLLPSRPIALSFPGIIRDLKAHGFEIGVHGYDHVRWQDRLDKIGESGVLDELGDAFEAYRAILGEAPRSFAAPGWRTNDAASTIAATRAAARRIVASSTGGFSRRRRFRPPCRPLTR